MTNLGIKSQRNKKKTNSIIILPCRGLKYKYIKCNKRQNQLKITQL